MSGPERRSGERRRGERRQAQRRHADAGGAPVAEGAGPSSSFSVSPPDAPSTLTAAFGGDPDPHDSPLPTREARRVASSADSALTRVVRTYAAARAAVGVALVGAQAATGLLGVQVTQAVVVICLLYAVQAALLWLLPSLRRLTVPATGVRLRHPQWLSTIGADLAAFGLLHALDAGASFNYAALLVLPVLMSGVLTSRLVALGTAAGVALLLLGVAWQAWPGGAGEHALVLSRSGLAGVGLFVIALLAGEMANRLAREELAARGSLELARQQAQLNRLVIEEMADGVLVVDRRLRVRAANPAARRLLAEVGMAPVAPFGLREQPHLGPLCSAVEQAMADDRWPDAGQDVSLSFGDTVRRTLRMRVRFTRGALAPDARDDPASGALEGLCVVLLEDSRSAAARLRQEKLAAMGRVSAGIAHEIRNPLAAISQANALIVEEGLPAGQERLARIVSDNVRRLQRIVDDVLEVAPGTATEQRCVEVRALVQQVAQEWADSQRLSLGDDGRIRLDLATGSLEVVFDPDHLRRVLLNLLENAVRHGTDQAQAVVLRLAARDEASAVLSVASDGPPIGADVEPHLFEPFFSTRSRGTGLGLFICRELCERYGASIEFRARAPSDRHRNGFVVVMRRCPASPAAVA